MLFVGERVLGIAAAADQRDHAVAHLEARGVGAHRFDGAGDLEPEDFGIPRRRRVVTLALDHVGPVDRGVHDLDQNLVAFR